MKTTKTKTGTAKAKAKATARTRAKTEMSCGCSTCGDESSNLSSNPKSEIRRRYGQLAKNSSEGTCCSQGYVTEEAGYSEEQLKTLPENALAASAGCGNPTALAELKEGEVVLDLGSGGGIDVFLAAKRVGLKGKAIGVDMTPEMLELARQNAARADVKNAEFRLGEIEHLPVADGSVDVIISNCVINLSPEKEEVFKEAYRVLKKGGRLLVSDMMVSGLPDAVRANLSIWASCIGGAVELEKYLDAMRRAGFTQIKVINNTEYSEELIKGWMTSIEGNLDRETRKELKSLANTMGEAKVSHADIRAVKT